MLRNLLSMHLEACFVLVRIYQETCDMDQIYANGQEQWLLSLGLENQSHTRLVIISQVDKVFHAIDQLGHQVGQDGLLQSTAEYNSIEDTKGALDKGFLALLLAAILRETEQEVQVNLLSLHCETIEVIQALDKVKYGSFLG